MLKKQSYCMFFIFCIFFAFSACTPSSVKEAEKDVKNAQSKIEELEQEVQKKIKAAAENPSDIENQNQLQTTIENLEEAKQKQKLSEINLEQVRQEKDTETQGDKGTETAKKKDYYFTHFSSYLFEMLNRQFKEAFFIVSNSQGGSVTMSSTSASDKCLKITEAEFSSSLNIKVKLIRKNNDSEVLLSICDNCPARTYRFEEEVTQYKKPKSRVNQWVSYGEKNIENEFGYFHLYTVYSLYSLAEDGKNVEDFLEHRPFYFNEMPDPNSKEYHFKPAPQSEAYIGIYRYRYNSGTWGSLLPSTSKISESDCKTLTYPASPL